MTRPSVSPHMTRLEWLRLWCESPIDAFEFEILVGVQRIVDDANFSLQIALGDAYVPLTWVIVRDVDGALQAVVEDPLPTFEAMQGVG